MDTGSETKCGQPRPGPRPRLDNDRGTEIAGLLTTGRNLPETFWPRLMALWGYAGTLPFFAAFRGRPLPVSVRREGSERGQGYVAGQKS